MSLNPETRALEYVSIADRQCYDFNGDLVRFFNKSLDCAVTPEHRMVYLNKGDGRIKYCPASEYRQAKGAFYRGAMYDAEDREWFEIEGRKIRFDDFCAFMGYYLSDGSLQHGTGVVIAQQAGMFAFYDIADTIAKMGYNISFTPDVINIYNSALNRYLSQFGRCNDKYIPNEIKTASKRQIQIFLDAFIKCDGHTRKCKSFVGNHGNTFHSDKEERMYFTTSERLAGDLSELILKVGHRPSFEFQEPKTAIKKDGSIIKSNYLCYRIRECYSTTATVFKKELMSYSGKVYDLTLERNHIMYVRRNGKCFWGSNCMCYSIPILKTEDEFFDEEGAPSVNEVEDVPQGFKDWIRDNEERIEKAEKRGTLPYFIRDNRDEVNRILEDKKGDKRKKTPHEIAAERHAARTPEEIERIQHIWNRRKEYISYLQNPNYLDVSFNYDNGGLKALHRQHNIDSDKGWYETFVQDIGYQNGHKVILESESGKAIGKNYTEGTWDNLQFELATKETGTPNNILRGLKHCSSKENVQMAVIFLPNTEYNENEFKRALLRYFGLINNGMPLKHFKRIVCVSDGKTVFDKEY